MTKYLRVKRNGVWNNIEVEHLTDKEREALLSSDPKLINWLHLVCKKLVKAEKILDELTDDGILSKLIER